MAVLFLRSVAQIREIIISDPSPYGFTVSFRDVSAQEDGFRIYLTPEGGGRFLALTMPASTGTEPGYETGKGVLQTGELEGLDPNTLYAGEIVAYNGSGESDALEFEAYTSPSSAPTSLVISGVTENSMNLTWVAASPAPLSGYLIEFRIGDETEWLPYASVTAVESTYGAVDLPASTLHLWRVVPYNNNGSYAAHAKGPPGNIASATTSVETIRPELVSVDLINSTTIKLTFDEPVTIGDDANVPTISTNGAAATLSAVSGTGTYELQYTLSAAAYAEDIITLSYTQPGDGIQDIAGNTLLTVSAVEVYNLSELTTRLTPRLDFETGVNPGNGWSSSGAVNWGSTTNPLAGLRSGVINPSNTRFTWTNDDGPIGSVYFYFVVRIDSAPTSGTHYMLLVRDALAASVCSLRLGSGMSMALTHGTTVASGSYPITLGGIYHIWVEWIKGTGANGVARLYISTTATKPGSATLSTAIGNATTDMTYIDFSSGSSGSGNKTFDNIDIRSVPIPSNPF